MGYRKTPKPNYRTIKVKVKATKHRKGYTATRRDLGKPGIGPKLIPIMEKGSLTKFGYSTEKAMGPRHEALEKAIRKYGALSVFRKLNAQVTLRKRTQPAARHVFQADADWVHREIQKECKIPKEYDQQAEAAYAKLK